MGSWEWDSETHLIKADARTRPCSGCRRRISHCPTKPTGISWTVRSKRSAPSVHRTRWTTARTSNSNCGFIRQTLALDCRSRTRAQRRCRQPHRHQLRHHRTKGTQGALHEYQERLLAILDQLPGGVGLFNKVGIAVMRGGPLAKLWADTLPSQDPNSRSRWRSFDAAEPRFHSTSIRGSSPQGRNRQSRDRLPVHRGGWTRALVPGQFSPVPRPDGSDQRRDRFHPGRRQGEALRRASAAKRGEAQCGRRASGTWPLFRGNQWRRTPADVGQSRAFPVGTAPRFRGHLRHVGKRRSLRRPRARASRRRQCLRPLRRWRLRCRISRHRCRRPGALVATQAQARFEHGQPVSLLGVVRDITDRKMIEHGLELVVDVRTSELIDASATLQAEREARATNRRAA